MQIRAERLKRNYEDKPAWKGEYQLQAGGMWFICRSGYGAIIYADRESALAGARYCRASEAGLVAVAKALAS